MNSRAKRAWIAAGSMVAITASMLSIFRARSGPDEGLAFHEHVGRVLAEQTAELLGGHGRVVILTLDPARFPIFRAQGNGFERELRRHPGMRLARRIVLQPTAESAYALGSGLAAAEFLRLRNESRQADALVSLVGVPSLRGEQIRKLGTGKPWFVAEAKFNDRLRKLLDHHVVQTAVVPRFLPATAGMRQPGASPAGRFELYFQVVKAPPPPAVASEQINPK